MLHPDIKPGEFIRGYRARQVAVNGRGGFVRPQKCSTTELFARIGIPLCDIVQMHTFVPYLRAIADGGHAAGKPLSLDQHYLRVSIFEAPVPQPRVCESCFREDLGFWGFAYFRREHQLPGVHFCLKHAEPLMLLPGTWAFDEVLRLKAAKAREREWQSEADISAVARFAEVSVGLLERKTLASRATIVQAIRSRLAEQGMDEAELSDAVDSAFGFEWQQNLELRGAGCGSARRYGALMERGTLRPRARPHIVPFIMALVALFESADEILNLFAGSRRSPREFEADQHSLMRALADFRAGVGLELAAAHHQISVTHLEAVIRELLRATPVSVSSR